LGSEGEAFHERRTNEVGGVQVTLLVLCIILLCRGKDEAGWVANFRSEPFQVSELFGFC